MIPSLLLFSISALNGVILTLPVVPLHIDEFGFGSRLCFGAVLGNIIFSLVGFLFAEFIFQELNLLVILLATILTSLPSYYVVRQYSKNPRPIRIALRRIEQQIMQIELWDYILLAALVTFSFFLNIAYVFPSPNPDEPGHIMICLMNNYGDLPFHVKMIMSFINGNNYPPVHPDLAGAYLNYSFLCNFMTAMWSVADNYGGASFGPESQLVDIWFAMRFQSFIFIIVFASLLYQFTMLLTKGDRMAAAFTSPLAFLSGGMGFTLFLSQVQEHGFWSFFDKISYVPRDYSIIRENGWNVEWGNLLTTVLLTQRSLFLGFPLAFSCFIIWYIVDQREEKAAKSSQQESTISIAAPQYADHESDVEEESVNHDSSYALGFNDDLRQRKSRPILPSTKNAGGETFRSQGSSFLRDAYDDNVYMDAGKKKEVEGNQNIMMMVALGACVGLFPLSHAHTYLVLMAVGGLMFLRDFILLGRPYKVCFLRWSLFAIVSMVIAIPQILWMMVGSSNDASKFIEWAHGWMKRPDENVLWFWFMNAGLFPFILFMGLIQPFIPRLPLRFSSNKEENLPMPRSAILFLIPFQFWFIVANYIKLNPWIWDNIKFMMIWYLASTPMVASMLSWMWRGFGSNVPVRQRSPVTLLKNVFYKTAVILIAISLIFTGFLDVWRVVSQKAVADEWNADDGRSALMIHQHTPKDALILHALTHNSPVHLAGRKSFVAYPGHLWSHGLNSVHEENEARQVLHGTHNWMEILQNNKIDYLFVGPQELQSAPHLHNFYDGKLQTVFVYKNYKLYDCSKPL